MAKAGAAEPGGRNNFADLLASQVAALAVPKDGKAQGPKDKNSNGKSAIAGLGAKLKAGAQARLSDQVKPGQVQGAKPEASQGQNTAENLELIKPLLGASKSNKAEALKKPDLTAKADPAREGAKPEEAATSAASLLAALKNNRALRAESKDAPTEEAQEKLEGLNRKEPGSAAQADGKEVKLTVSDLRQAHKTKPEAQVDPGSAAATGPARPGQEKPLREVSLDLDLSKTLGNGRLGNGLGQAPDSSFSPTQAAPARDFTSVLTEQLKATWNGDIVSNAHLILKDGDTGAIRLRLHPDSLGSVKIELQLADKSISGKIIVESDEAKTAFERNMSQLQDAFKQGGFESARLEVQVGSGNSGAAGGQGQDGPTPYWSERRGLDSLAVAVPEIGQESRRARARGGVDLLA